ncbi:hypothetical protein PR048_010396 [Dryococelus australis]|uniref:Uncharacterized protein n=1 Tax=Dryococelus australis TaxID=614101 RepID=A0ABQ9I336_9NEOP|nr:hypothetical protein PR048_010396 [Dryococelus australis]
MDEKSRGVKIEQWRNYMVMKRVFPEKKKTLANGNVCHVSQIRISVSTPPKIESDSPWWEASSVATEPPRDLLVYQRYFIGIECTTALSAALTPARQTGGRDFEHIIHASHTFSFAHALWGRGGVVVRLLASRQVGFPAGGHPGFLRADIVPDAAAGRQVFSGISRSPPLSHSDGVPRTPRLTLIMSRDPDANLSTGHALRIAVGRRVWGHETISPAIRQGGAPKRDSMNVESARPQRRSIPFFVHGKCSSVMDVGRSHDCVGETSNNDTMPIGEQKHGSDKGDPATRLTCHIAVKRKAGRTACTYGTFSCDHIILLMENLQEDGATVAKRLARSPPIKANRALSPPGSPDFCKWELCRAMPMVGGFFSGIAHFPAPSLRRRSIFTSTTLMGSQDLTRQNAEAGETGDPRENPHGSHMLKSRRPRRESNPVLALVSYQSEHDGRTEIHASEGSSCGRSGPGRCEASHWGGPSSFPCDLIRRPGWLPS